MNAHDILEAARSLTPEIASRAEEIASQRRLPADLVGKLKSAGVFPMPMPTAWGGPEMTPRQQCEVVEILSSADASVGWCAKIGSDSGYLAAFLEERAARELFPDLDMIFAGQIPPNGRAERVPGGYRVSGRWRFGSGCMHAGVIGGGCFVFENGQLAMMKNGPPGAPEQRIVMAPASKWQIHDTWYSTGLAGSGSNDYSAESLFVPEEHTINAGLDSPIRQGGPLYAYRGTLMYSWAGVALGLARHALDAALTVTGSSKVLLPPPPRPAKMVPSVRAALATAEMLLGAARAYSYETLDSIWTELQAGRELSPVLRRALMQSTMVTEMLFDTVGTTALYSKCPLDRLLRDSITMSQHGLLQEGMLESAGTVMVGEPSPLPTLF